MKFTELMLEKKDESSIVNVSISKEKGEKKDFCL